MYAWPAESLTGVNFRNLPEISADIGHICFQNPLYNAKILYE